MPAVPRGRQPARKAATARAALAQSSAVLGLMTVVAVPTGVEVTYIAQDALVGVMAGALAAVLLVALLQMLGVLGDG